MKNNTTRASSEIKIKGRSILEIGPPHHVFSRNLQIKRISPFWRLSLDSLGEKAEKKKKTHTSPGTRETYKICVYSHSCSSGGIGLFEFSAGWYAAENRHPISVCVS
ncbi:hypothetical protein CEXT_675441 [Caerostris extrusa]|uniref:Uncharacterized protein n=1 Tax=Caerostris extrusa TaxID=172846 RepID=A0AAV4XBN0_CAEEX|nr:hypothetical protein CEXT_675441 [Caerostris extrusa]